MKPNFLKPVIAFAIVVFISSCSKEEIVSPQAGNNNSDSNVDIVNLPPASSTGVVAGKITTTSKYELKLYNLDHTLTNFNVDLRTGYFYFKDVLPGVYTLLIHPLDPGNKDREILKISVVKGQITNIGEIFL